MDEYVNIAARYSGLTDAAAYDRIGMYGYNRETVDEDEKEPFPIKEFFFSLPFILMLMATIVFFVDSKIAEGVIMLLSTTFYAVFEVLKRKKCNEESEKLRRNDGFQIRVIRNGELSMMDSYLLVPDDIIILQEGESVPADLHILECDSVTADESIFTGDRTPAAKVPGMDNKNEFKQSCLYKGSRIISGNLAGRVTATGVDTLKYKSFGKSDIDNEHSTSFEKILTKFLPFASIGALIIFIILTFFYFTRDHSTTVGGLLSFVLLPAIAVSLCAIPAQTVSTVRIFYLAAAQRILKKHTVIKNLRALESLNAMTAICIDKSGIITKNRIGVAEEYSQNIEMLTNISVLACDVNPTRPFDQAIILNAAFRQADVKGLTSNELVKIYPFSEEDKIGGNLWEIGGSRILCIKGAPEKIYTLCGVDHEQLFTLQEKRIQLSKKGHQVIAVAYAQIPEEKETPESVYDVQFKVLGLISFNSQIRHSIPLAVRNCYKAGVNVIMTTGDSPEAAKTIAGKIGMMESNAATGDIIKKAVAEGKMLNVRGVNIFAGISAEQKPDILDFLQNSGEIVGIISDNNADIGLLENADIGISVLQNSSSSVRQASDVILADDDFGDFVDTIKETRQMHTNIKSCISLSLSVTGVLIVFSIINLLFLGELMFNVIITSLISSFIMPACMFSYLNNRSEVKLIQRSSDFIGRGKINKKFLLKSAIQSGLLLISLLITYFITAGNPVGVSRGCVFFAFVSGVVTMTLTNISKSIPIHKTLFKNQSNELLYSGIILLIPLFLIYVPVVNRWFGFDTVNPLLLLAALVLGVLSQGWNEFKKIIKK